MATSDPPIATSPSRLARERQHALRWLLALTGTSLLIPGIIHLFSWSDTVKASQWAFGEALASAMSAGAVVALLGSGLSFLFGREVRKGALLAITFLAFGTYVHIAWALMLQGRMDMMPPSLDPVTQQIWEDTTLFASNSQIPHVMKNLVLMGICALFYIEAPDLFPERESR